MTEPITVRTTVHAPIEAVWECWTEPEHISGWAFASDDWQAHPTENDLRPGGHFSTTMSAKDGSAGFDFSGTYSAVTPPTDLAFDLDDGRQVVVAFEDTPEGVRVVETFDPESENPHEMQRAGWQGFLDNFARYVESRQR